MCLLWWPITQGFLSILSHTWPFPPPTQNFVAAGHQDFTHVLLPLMKLVRAMSPLGLRAMSQTQLPLRVLSKRPGSTWPSQRQNEGSLQMNNGIDCVLFYVVYIYFNHA